MGTFLSIYGASGGISPELMLRAISLVKGYLPVRGCAIASYDPAYDSDARFLQAGLESIRQIVSALHLPEGTQMG
mgnify:FL=1